MTTIWLYALGSTAGVSLISLIGVITLSVNERKLRQIVFGLVALATGALFGDVIIHLLPEIFKEGEDSVSDGLPAALTILLGILIFFCLEKFLHWRHSHGLDDCKDPNHSALIHPLGHLNLIADGLHNLIDGAIIGVSFLVSPTVGFATAIAVALHEIPQEIGDFGILLHAGFSRTRALLFNLLSAFLALIGVIAALLLGNFSEAVIIVSLSLAAGGFLYIAGSDLVPELHKTTDPGKSLSQLITIALGIGLMALLAAVE